MNSLVSRALARARPPATTAPSGGPLPPGTHDENPRGISLLGLIQEDFATHGRSLRAAGFWALLAHRLGNARMAVRPRLLRAPLTVVYRAAYQAVIAFGGIDLPYNVRLGRRVRFVHGGCIVMGAWSVGDDVIVHGPATIGLVRRGASEAPIIGNRVEIGPRACIVGGIRVGHDAFVGACTVLTQDLPAGAQALGNPCRRVDLHPLLGAGSPLATPARSAP